MLYNVMLFLLSYALQNEVTNTYRYIIPEYLMLELLTESF